MQSRPSRQLCLPVTIVLVALFALPGWAQRRKEVPRETFRGVGQIKDVRADVFHVVNETGDQWLVKVEAAPDKIVYRAVAGGDFIGPGMFVQFDADIDRNGLVAGPLRQVEIFSPGERTRMGVFPKKRRKGKNADPPQPRPDVASFRVVGRVRSLKGDVLSVAAGNASVRASLGKETEVAVQLADYRFARVGDAIEVQGWHVPGQEKLIHATGLTITADKPISKKVARSR